MATLITVVVPCFNYGHFLEQCVESVSRQSHQDWECIIVDDGSTDDTPAVCSFLAGQNPKITYIRQANFGLSAARNAGIRRARGELIQLLDADDLLEPHKLRAHAEYLDANPRVDIVVGRAGFFDTETPRTIRAWRKSGVNVRMEPPPSPRPPDILRALVEGNMLVVHATLVRPRVFESVGYFDDSLRAYEDWDFWLRCALAGKQFAFISAAEDRALVREHTANMTWNRTLMIATAMRVREQIHPRLSPELQRENAQRLARFKLKLAVELLRNGNTAEGWRLLWSAWGESPQKLSAAAELAGLIPGAFQAFHLGRRLYARWRASANGHR